MTPRCIFSGKGIKFGSKIKDALIDSGPPGAASPDFRCLRGFQQLGIGQDKAPEQSRARGCEFNQAAVLIGKRRK